MSLIGDDYDWLKTQTCYDTLDIVLSCGVDSTFWEGVINYPLGFTFDDDNCRAELTDVKPNDHYSDNFDDGMDVKTQPTNANQVIAWEANVGGTNEQIQLDAWTCDGGESTLLRDILDDILNGFEPGMTCYSRFFWNDYTATTDNYVTGDDPNPLNYLIFVMIDHIANGTTPAYPEFTWPEICGILYDMFQVYWYAYSATDIRFEHIQWWETLGAGTLRDLTTYDDGMWLERTSKYRHAIEQVPLAEWWYWDTDYYGTSNDWAQVQQLYTIDPSKTAGVTFIKEHTGVEGTQDSGPVSTDIVHCAGLGANQEGFLILRCHDYTLWNWAAGPTPDGVNRPNLPTACSGGAPNYVVWYEQGVNSGVNHINAHLSGLSLVDHYWTRWRAFDSYTVTALGAQTADSVEPIQLQTEFSFPICCSKIGPVSRITNQYGSAYIYSATYLSNGMMRVELLNVDPCADV